MLLVGRWWGGSVGWVGTPPEGGGFLYFCAEKNVCTLKIGVPRPGLLACRVKSFSPAEASVLLFESFGQMPIPRSPKKILQIPDQTQYVCAFLTSNQKHPHLPASGSLGKWRIEEEGKKSRPTHYQTRFFFNFVQGERCKNLFEFQRDASHWTHEPRSVSHWTFFLENTIKFSDVMHQLNRRVGEWEEAIQQTLSIVTQVKFSTH